MEKAKRPSWEASEATYLAGRSHLDGADHLAIEMERKWGVGRLRLLVGADLRERFDRQRSRLNTAILTGDVADVQQEATRMCAAWRALDGAAEAAGELYASPWAWEHALPDGAVLVIQLDPWVPYNASGRRVQVWSMAEIAEVISKFPEVAKAKETWPGATVEKIRRPIIDPLESWEALERGDDEIPF